MKLRILFGQRKESYEGEHAPEALLCWSEYDVDENPEGFDEAVASAQEQAAKDFVATRVFTVNVDGDAIRQGLVGELRLTGKVEPVHTSSEG